MRVRVRVRVTRTFSSNGWPEPPPSSLSASALSASSSPAFSVMRPLPFFFLESSSWGMVEMEVEAEAEAEAEAEVEAGIGRLGSHREGRGAPSTVLLLQCAFYGRLHCGGVGARACGRDGPLVADGERVRGARRTSLRPKCLKSSLWPSRKESRFFACREQRRGRSRPWPPLGRPSAAPRPPLASRAAPRRKAHARRYRRSSPHTRALPPCRPAHLRARVSQDLLVLRGERLLGGAHRLLLLLLLGLRLHAHAHAWARVAPCMAQCSTPVAQWMARSC